MHVVCGVGHGDIKGDNIMFNDDLTLAFIDFGHSEVLGTLIRERIGSPKYQAPEVLRSLPQFKIDKADIYALSSTLFTILFLNFPFNKTSEFSNFNFSYDKFDSTHKSEFFEKHYGNFPAGKERHP